MQLLTTAAAAVCSQSAIGSLGRGDESDSGGGNGGNGGNGAGCGSDLVMGALYGCTRPASVSINQLN